MASEKFPKYVVTVEETSSGSDDYGDMRAYLFIGVHEATAKLTEWGFKRDDRFTDKDKQVWERYGGFHNEQRAIILPIKEEF